MKELRVAELEYQSYLKALTKLTAPATQRQAQLYVILAHKKGEVPTMVIADGLDVTTRSAKRNLERDLQKLEKAGLVGSLWVSHEKWWWAKK